MADVPILVCECGLRMRAPGAVPGRVGKCPVCGAAIRVPDPDAPVPAPVRPMKKRKRKRADARDWDGFVHVPKRPETRLRDSLLYPFWGANGLAILGYLPPILWLVSLPLPSVVLLIWDGTTPLQMVGAIWLVPPGLGLVIVLGYTLLFLGRVLESSAQGEVRHPRLPDGALDEVFRGLWRWAWALVIGGALGLVPAVAYWMSCGDVDLFDRVVLGELLALGMVYGLMALLAAILHDDPWGANPLTVLGALWRVGWRFTGVCLCAGFAALLAGMAFAWVIEVRHPLLAAVSLWVFWVFGLYEAMVVLRVLGLCAHRNARRLGWFRDRRT